jgi:predicted SAM-dependent methyltransferase
MFNSLVKYLINNKYDIYKFLNYSKTQEHKEYSTDAIEHYINGINDAHYYYKNILLYIAKQYNLKFITKSTLTDQFINYVNTITNTELKQQLLAFDDIAREASEWKKDRFIYNYKHYKINIREHTIADINKNTFYYEPQDSTNINSTYKNECNSTITNIETLKNHIKTTKTKTKLIFVKALYGSGKTKEIINTALDKFLTQSPNNKVLFITENNTLNSEITAKLKNTFKEFNVSISQFNRKIENYNINLLPIEELFQLEPAKYEVITLWHVLEHVHDLNTYMKTFHSLLKPNGRLIIAVPNYTSYDAGFYKNFWAAYDVPRHLYHFSPLSMHYLAKKHKMSIVQKLPMWFDSFYVSLLSEKYKQSGMIGMMRAFFVGCISNLIALRNADRGSSIIYEIKKMD